MAQDIAPSQTIHGSAVAIEGRGLLILGASGSGKSSLALHLIALGGTLIADDGVLVGDVLSAPEATAGLIEARGVGLLRLPHTEAPLHAAVDLDRTEAARLPHRHEVVIAGQTVPCLRRVESPAFAAMLTLFMKGGRHAP